MTRPYSIDLRERRPYVRKPFTDGDIEAVVAGICVN